MATELDRGDPSHEDHPYTIARNARYGLALFAVYVVLYGGFVALNAFRPQLMATEIADVNLAIWYGFGLIVAAIVLALVYMVMCRPGSPDAGKAR